MHTLRGPASPWCSATRAALQQGGESASKSGCRPAGGCVGSSGRYRPQAAARPSAALPGLSMGRKTNCRRGDGRRQPERLISNFVRDNSRCRQAVRFPSLVHAIEHAAGRQGLLQGLQRRCSHAARRTPGPPTPSIRAQNSNAAHSKLAGVRTADAVVCARRTGVGSRGRGLWEPFNLLGSGGSVLNKGQNGSIGRRRLLLFWRRTFAVPHSAQHALFFRLCTPDLKGFKQTQQGIALAALSDDRER